MRLEARDAGGRPVLAAAAGAGCIAFSAILVRLAEVSPDTAAVFRCLYALPVLGLLAWRERRRYGPRGRRERRIAVLAGVFFALDLVFWHRSIGAVGAGLATVLGNLQVVMVGLVAWALLGERPTSRLLAAIPVVVTGIVLISGVLEEGADGDDPVAGTVYGILTAAAYTVFVLLLRNANRDLRRPAGPLFDATLAATVVSAIAGLALRDLDLVPPAEAQAWLVLLALTAQVAGWLLISVSLPRLPAAVTAAGAAKERSTSVLPMESITWLFHKRFKNRYIGCGVVSPSFSRARFGGLFLFGGGSQSP